MQTNNEYKKEILDENNNLLAIVIDTTLTKQKKEFHTPEHLSFQIGTFNLSKDDILQRHVHFENLRTVKNTAEVLVVFKGEISIEVYDTSKKFVENILITDGQLILFLEGGHSFKAEKDSNFIEIKQGPYSEIQDKEKF